MDVQVGIRYRYTPQALILLLPLVRRDVSPDLVVPHEVVDDHCVALAAEVGVRRRGDQSLSHAQGTMRQQGLHPILLDRVHIKSC